MKKLIVCLCVLMGSLCGHAQRDTVAVDVMGVPMTGEDTVLEELVKMAMNNPRIRSTVNNAIQYEYLYRRDRTAYLNQLVVSGNLNEISIKGNSNTDPAARNFVYPRYNIGLAVPLGLFVNNKKQQESSLHRYKAAADAVDIEKQTLRREVAVLYEQWQMNKTLVDLEDEVLNDAKMVYDRNEEKFTAGEISLEVYSTTVRSYNAEKVRMVNLQFAVTQAETYLEELIGMRFKDALQQITIRMTSRR